MRPTIGVIIPSISNPFLQNTIDSILSQELIQGDQFIIVGDGYQEYSKSLCEKYKEYGFEYMEYEEHNWGNPQRNYALPFLRTDLVCWMDEDDIYLENAFKNIRNVSQENPNKILIFKFILYRGHPTPILWATPEIRNGNVGGHIFVAPNNPSKLGKWELKYDGDFDFITSTIQYYASEEVIWREEIIVKCRPHLGN